MNDEGEHPCFGGATPAQRANMLYYEFLNRILGEVSTELHLNTDDILPGTEEEVADEALMKLTGRATVFGVVGLPLCIIVAFLGLLLAGRTINVISLAGIAFALGGVDDFACQALTHGLLAAVAGVLHQRHVHAQADTEEGDAVLAGVPDGPQLAVDAAHAESAGDADGVDAGQRPGRTLGGDDQGPFPQAAVDAALDGHGEVGHIQVDDFSFHLP